MKIKLDFVTNSSSVSYTIIDNKKDRKELIINLEGIDFDLFKYVDFYKFETIQDLIDEGISGSIFDRYKDLIESGKTIYEIWTNGQGSLIKSFLYYNKIKLPKGMKYIEDV